MLYHGESLSSTPAASEHTSGHPEILNPEAQHSLNALYNMVFWPKSLKIRVLRALGKELHSGIAEICLDAPANMAFVPCGHLAVCEVQGGLGAALEGRGLGASSFSDLAI